MATMTDFRVENLTKSVGDKTVFSKIDFIIHPLDRIGLIGVNDTRKTTLLDVISGKAGFDGDNSPFFTRNDFKIEYLTQEPQFDETLSIIRQDKARYVSAKDVIDGTVPKDGFA